MRWVFKWINDESNSSWISLKCFQVSNSCLMDLGCPLLLGSSVRRLRRHAATLPHLLEWTFPGSIFFSFSWAVTAAGKELMEENIFFLAHRLNKMYHRSSSCRTSTSCWRRSRSLGASILGTVPTAQVTPGYNCCRWHLRCYLLLPSLPGC